MSTQIADIFRGKAARNGLLPILVDTDTHHWLLTHNEAEVSIDLPSRTLTAEGGPRVTFPFDSFIAHCLIHGFDELGYLLRHVEAIATYEESHP